MKPLVNLLCAIIAGLTIYFDIFEFYEPILSTALGTVVCIALIIILSKRRFRLFKTCLVMSVIWILVVVASGSLANKIVDKYANELITKLLAYKLDNGTFPDNLGILDKKYTRHKVIRLGSRVIYQKVDNIFILTYQCFPLSWKVYNQRTGSIELIHD